MKSYSKIYKKINAKTSLKTSLKYYRSTIRSNNGRTPIDRAVNANNEEALLLLQNLSKRLVNVYLYFELDSRD